MMKSWLLSIGVVLLMITSLNLILPEGKTGKTIKNIFSLILLMVVIRPVLNIKNANNFTFFQNQDNIIVNEDFIEQTYNKRIDFYVNDCKKLLKNYGVMDSNVQMIYEIDENYNLIINKIIIKFDDEVINSVGPHIDIIENIKESISNSFNLDKKDILINQ